MLTEMLFFLLWDSFAFCGEQSQLSFEKVILFNLVHAFNSIFTWKKLNIHDWAYLNTFYDPLFSQKNFNRKNSNTEKLRFI